MDLEYFTVKEINDASFGCDNGFNQMNQWFLIMCDQLRHSCGFALTLTCAFRTKEHDLLKGRSGKSDHCKGMGVDFAIIDMAHALVIQAHASRIGFNAFAINLEENFIHVGLRPGLPYGVIKTWNY